jgi:hypothetical protein
LGTGHPQGGRFKPQTCSQSPLADDADTTDLVGSANEATVVIEGTEAAALLDTGSAVSTVSEQFFESTPVLLGTNFIAKVGSKRQTPERGSQYLQQISGQSAWYMALRCLTVRERQLKKNHHRIAVVRSAESVKKTVQPNETVTLRGYCDKAMPYHTTCALLQPLRTINNDLDLSPSLVTYHGRNTGLVDITFSNLSTHTVTLNPKALLCELQPVDITSMENVPPEEQDSLLSEVNIDISRLTPEEQQKGKDFILEHKDLFSRSETDVGLYARVKQTPDQPS